MSTDISIDDFELLDFDAVVPCDRAGSRNDFYIGTRLGCPEGTTADVKVEILGHCRIRHFLWCFECLEAWRDAPEGWYCAQCGFKLHMMPHHTVTAL